MALSTNDSEASKFKHTFTKLNIGTTACHVGRNCYISLLACLCNYLSLKFMELSIKYLVRDMSLLQHIREFLGLFNGNGTYEYRLSLLISLCYIINNGIKFFFSCLVYGIIMVNSLYRTVGRNGNNIHTIDVPELLFLCKSCTCHTCFLLIFIEEVLEGNGCKSTAFSINLNLFLSLYSLVKTIRIPSTRHYTSCKLINYKDFIILNYIVLILKHKVMCTKSKDDIVLDLKIFRISKVLYIKKFFHLSHTIESKAYILILFIYYEITCLDYIFTHNGINLAKLLVCLTFFELSCKNITKLIKLGGLSTLS